MLITTLYFQSIRNYACTWWRWSNDYCLSYAELRLKAAQFQLGMSLCNCDTNFRFIKETVLLIAFFRYWKIRIKRMIIHLKIDIELTSPTEAKETYECCDHWWRWSGVGPSLIILLNITVLPMLHFRKAVFLEEGILRVIGLFVLIILTLKEWRFYKRVLWTCLKELSNEFDFNIMYSSRGQLTLAHTDSTFVSFRKRTEVNTHFAVKQSLWPGNKLKNSSLHFNIESCRHAVWQGYGIWMARRASFDAVCLGYAKRCNPARRWTSSITEVMDVIVEKW